MKKIYTYCLIASIGSFLFGYDTAVISGAIEALENFFIIPYCFTDNVANLLLGILVSGALIGCIIGSTLGGYISQKFGRKKGMLIAAILFFISALGSAIPEIGITTPLEGDHTLLPAFIIYRILGGIGVGLASMVCPLYNAELAPQNIRGKLVSWNQMAIVIGILVVYFVNYYISSSGDQGWNLTIGWRLMFASSAIPAILFLVLVLFVPETPRWLVMNAKESKAIKIMQQLQYENAENEVIAIRETINNSETKDSSIKKNVKIGVKVWFAGILLSAFQQLLGIQVVMYYAPELFKNMGSATDSAMFQTILVGIVNFSFTIVAIFTVDKYGRKPLLLIGSILMAVFMTTLTVCFYTGNMGILAIMAVLGFVASFAFSWGPVTWVLLAEMFPNAVRSKIMSVAVAAQWITNYLVSSTFPVIDNNKYLNENFGHSFSFGLFGLMALLSAIFVWKMIPETKGKSLEEISKMWNIKAE